MGRCGKVCLGVGRSVGSVLGQGECKGGGVQGNVGRSVGKC